MRAGRWVWGRVFVVCALIVLSTVSACVSPLEPAEPMIVLYPTTGGPGTSVRVSGSGFPAQIRVSVRLGPPSVGATPTSYGDVETDASGRFTLPFTMPSHWPDGTPIVETNLVVVALNQDGSIKATAAFDYIPFSTGVYVPMLGAQGVDRAMILAWHREGDAGSFCGDVLVYENGYAEIASCESAGSLERRQLSKDTVDQLQIWAATYQAFEIERIQGTGSSQVRTRTTFAGKGRRQVSEIELRTIQTLLEVLVP